MNTEDVLTDLFTRQADGRPDPAEVLNAVHQRIARQRRITGPRAASALGAAAAVAAIAVTAGVLTTSGGHRTEPAGGPLPSMQSSSAPATPPSSTPAAPKSTASPTHRVPVSRTAPPPSSAPRVAGRLGGRSYSTINAGWLPGPATQDPAGTSNRPGFEERDWDVDVDGVAMDVIIWTESGSLPSRMQATGGKSSHRKITVNGHAGREFVSANITIVAFDLGNGTVAYVGPSVQHTTATVTSARITAIAAKVARHMQFDRHDPIPAR